MWLRILVVSLVVACARPVVMPLTPVSIAPRQLDRPLEPMVTALADKVAERCWTRAGPPADIRVDLRMTVDDGRRRLPFRSTLWH